MIGNCEKLYHDSVCKNIIMHISGLRFLMTLYVLPIQGSDIVLGVEWLETFGPITIEYFTLTM